MAGRAVLIELRQLVIRFGGLIIIGLMARETCGRSPGILSRVTGNTDGLRMRAGQWERSRAMIIERRLPGSDRVTKRAVMRKSTGLMIRFNGRREVRAVTGITIRRRTAVAGYVTGLAGDALVTADEGERGRVIVFGIAPACRCCRVTFLTLDRETRLSMNWLFGRGVNLAVTVVAIHRRSGIFLSRVAAMA